MTTTESPALNPDATELLDAMTRAIALGINSDDALSDLIFDAMIGNDALESIFTPAALHRFLLAFDCCPEHRTDLDSCYDDDLPECRALRLALRPE
jgi:hypothetical protein